MRLLIAEDDPKLLKTLKHIFESNKYMVDGVGDGQDALIYAETQEYDGLVLDIMMPGLNGMEVLKRLRSQGISTPALFLRPKRKSISVWKGWTPVRMTICQNLLPLRNCWQGYGPCSVEKTILSPIY